MRSISHPGVLLLEHLKAVAAKCKKTITSLTLQAEYQQILADLAFICGAFHDLGKATYYFQTYIISEGKTILGPKNHSLISSLFVKEISRIYLSKTGLPQFEQELFSHFCFIAVKRHHGSLSNLSDELTETGKKKDELKEQIVVFYEEDVSEILHHFLPALGITYSFREFKEYIDTSKYDGEFEDFWYHSILFGTYSEIGTYRKIQFHYFHQLLFSTLLLSDKSDVIFHEGKPQIAQYLTYKLLSDFRSKNGFENPRTEINKIQNEAFYEGLSHLKKIFSRDHHIYSLTLPTGIGKTITSFGIALELKDLLGKDCKNIIVTIPFTSIIDQNYQVYEKIIQSGNSDIILKHHHLAEPKYKLEDEQLDAGKSAFLIETWQSEMVVTTFVQLLNSLFSNDKSLLMKIPALANSIIILDEVQSIHYGHWELISHALEVIGKTYGCYFILMSATQPLIFTPGNQIREIIPGYQKYFSYFNRTRIINRLNTKIDLETFIDILQNYLDENPEKDVLIILNTKKSSRDVFEALADYLDRDNELYYLSTLITPFERKKIIENIKTPGNRRKVIVSTQLIEAGVDISVDTVFRCLAPLDSIIQAAGRANRYGEKSAQGEVHLYEISDNGSSSKIYGPQLLQKTKNIFSGIKAIEEKDYLSLIEKYFIEVRKESERLPSPYLENILRLQFKDLGQFALIEEECQSESVYVQLNQEAKDLWQKYVTICSEEADLFVRKEKFAEIKSRFYDYVINVPIRWKESRIDFDSDPIYGFYVSSLNSPSVYYPYCENDYRKNTGYKKVNGLIL